MTTHSPAPWRHCPKTGQIVDADNRQLARVWQTRDRERDHANGELIARAPALAVNYDVACEDLARLAGEYDAVRMALAQCVAAIDALLPGAQHIPVDVGLINEALLTARPLLEDV